MLEATQYRPEFTLASLEHLVGPLDFDLDHGMIYRVPDLESIDFDIDSRCQIIFQQSLLQLPMAWILSRDRT